MLQLFLIKIRKAMEDFANSYDVEYIIKRRTIRGQIQYFVKWQGFAHRENSWIAKDDFIDKDFPNQWEQLSIKEKRNNLKKYKIAMIKQQNKAHKHNCIAGLSYEKIKNKCDNDKNNLNVYKNGVELYKNGLIYKRCPLAKGHRNLSGVIQSERTKGIVYKCSAICNENGDIRFFGCECMYQQMNKKYICKHLVCLLYDRCITTKHNKNTNIQKEITELDQNINDYDQEICRKQNKKKKKNNK